VARSTRQQRRLRRAQAAGTPPLRPAVRAVPAEEPVEAVAEEREARPGRRDELRPGVPGVRFFQESYAELKKVEWPSQQAVISGTAVVIIACLIVGAYLWLNDEVWKHVVQHLLLR
jgi:preprotein translocase SecE subunit